MIAKKRIIDAIRANLDLKSNISDDEIYKVTKNSLTYAFTGFDLAIGDLSKAVKENIWPLNKL